MAADHSAGCGHGCFCELPLKAGDAIEYAAKFGPCSRGAVGAVRHEAVDVGCDADSVARCIASQSSSQVAEEQAKRADLVCFKGHSQATIVEE